MSFGDAYISPLNERKGKKLKALQTVVSVGPAESPRGERRDGLLTSL